MKLIAADYAEHQAGVLNADAREELRDLQGELRRIAQAVDDPGLRDQLRAASERLAGLGQPRVLDAAAGAQAVGPGTVGPGTVGPGAVGPQLSPRELDVLAQVALGCGNAEIARRLSLRPETVKAYLRSATGKLEVHNRNEAVVTARRLGLLALPSQARLVVPAPPQPLNGHFAPYRARAEGEQTNECDNVLNLLGSSAHRLEAGPVAAGPGSLADHKRTPVHASSRPAGLKPLLRVRCAQNRMACARAACAATRHTGRAESAGRKLGGPACRSRSATRALVCGHRTKSCIWGIAGRVRLACPRPGRCLM